jgi:hypothetical protein
VGEVSEKDYWRGRQQQRRCNCKKAITLEGEPINLKKD